MSTITCRCMKFVLIFESRERESEAAYCFLRWEGTSPGQKSIVKVYKIKLVFLLNLLLQCTSYSGIIITAPQNKLYFKDGDIKNGRHSDHIQKGKNQ